jgi:hypothetical protein
MAKTVFAVLGGALVLIGSFFLSLKLFDYFGLFSSGSGPVLSLTVDGKDSIAMAAGTYNLAYSTPAARSCEMTYRNVEDGSSGRIPVPPNTNASNASGLIGDYTLTCIGLDGVTLAKSVRISRTPK